MTSSTNNDTNSHQQQRRRRRSRYGFRLVSTTVALMLSYGVTPSQCFSASVARPSSTTTTTSSSSSISSASTTADRSQTTRRFFRNAADSTTSTAPSTFAPESFLSQQQNHYYNNFNPPLHQQQQQRQSQNNQRQLPTWLQENKDELWDTHWERLRGSMLKSFFTPKETLRLLTAIEQAAQGNRHQMAGAAEFCLILVETMEMGLTALTAAAFHYCQCVTARQISVASSSTSSQHPHGNVWDDESFAKYVPEALVQYGEHATAIAGDAARLKTLEMVAATIYSDKAASRVTPDAMDSENLRSLLLTETKDWRALAIRSAAALYRLKGILRHYEQRRKKQMDGSSFAATAAAGAELRSPEALQVSREALYIYAPLASRLGMHRLKNELEGAAFRILYRRQYEKVNRLARELRPRHSKPHLNRGLVEMCDNSLDISSCMRNVLSIVKRDMTELLEQDVEFNKYVQDFSVTARVKEPYSMWKKMLRNSCQHITEVPDAIALRIVLDAKPNTEEGEDEEVKRARERALCYYAQTLCMEQWKPVEPDPRFKDYIDRPKHNGYQSLHYTAHTSWDNEDWNLEIQVRSGEMHQVAEFGLASHWDYKAQQQRNNNNHNNDAKKEVTIQPEDSSSTSGGSRTSNPDAYLRSVQEWHWQQHAGQSIDSAPATSTTTTATATSIDSHSFWSTDEISPNEYHDIPPSFAVSDNSGRSLEASRRADRIRARTKKLQPYIEALSEAQSDLAREHVFVFLTFSSSGGDDNNNNNNNNNNKGDGKVLSLPAGACVLDAIREGEKNFGFPFPWKEDAISLNGHTAIKVTSRLENGDILTVPYNNSNNNNNSASNSNTAVSP